MSLLLILSNSSEFSQLFFFYFSSLLFPCISFLHLYWVLSLNLLVCLCASFSVWFPLSWVLRIPEWRNVKMILWAEAHNYMLEPWIPSTSWFSEHSCDSIPQFLSQEQTEFQNLSLSCLPSFDRKTSPIPLESQGPVSSLELESLGLWQTFQGGAGNIEGKRSELPVEVSPALLPCSF